MLPTGGATTGGTDGTRDEEHDRRRHGAAGADRAVRGAPRRPRRRLAGLRGVRMARGRAPECGDHGRGRDRSAAATRTAATEGVLGAGHAHADLRERLGFVALVVFVVFLAPAFLVFFAAALAGRAAAAPSPPRGISSNVSFGITSSAWRMVSMTSAPSSGRIATRCSLARSTILPTATFCSSVIASISSRYGLAAARSGTR